MMKRILRRCWCFFSPKGTNRRILKPIIQPGYAPTTTSSVELPNNDPDSYRECDATET